MRSRLTFPALALLALAACDNTGPTLAPLTLEMVRADGSGAAATEFWASIAGQTVAVPTSSVATLVVAVDRVEVLPQGGSEGEGEGEGAWVSLDVTLGGSIDLMALPTDAAAAIKLAAGTVPVGSYSRVRLFYTEANVTFNTDVTVGGQTFTAGVEYPVTFPSGTETGIKTRAGFDVAAGGADVALAFDAATSFSHVTATGDGKVVVPPVLLIKS